MAEEFLINELAKMAGVTVRTIRYYTDEKLLPEPIIRGKYGYYTQEHLDRLELIGRLKRRFLPLQEIRALLENATDEDVRKLMGMQDTFAGKPVEPPAYLKMSGAMKYIAELRSQPEWKVEEGPIPTRGHTSRNQPTPPRPTPVQQPGEETWKRIILAPGIELHIREKAGQDTAARIDELIRYCNQIFNQNRGGN